MIYVIVLLEIILVGALFWCSIDFMSPVNSIMCPKLRESMDAQTCDQMREQGWSEQKIESFMVKHGGYYDEPLNELKTELVLS